jgi:signal transduction histidine kinase
MDRVGGLNPLRWPIVVRVPMLFAAFMICVSAILTNAVLVRLAETQERQLAQASRVYLEGLASAITPYVLRDDVWEIFDAIERSAGIGSYLGLTHVVVANPARRVMASSNPLTAPVGSDARTLMPALDLGETLRIDLNAGAALALKPLRYQGRDIGEISASFDISTQLNERRDVLNTLLLTNGLVAIVLAAIGYWMIRRMLNPLALLTDHLGQDPTGHLKPIDLPSGTRPDTEFGRLFIRFNAMAEAVNEREALARQLASEERLVSLGRLASGMAHEINNPLGGLFNTIDTLRQHGARESVRRSAIDLIERGLRGIKDVVSTTLVTFRADRVQRPTTPGELDDMRLLIRAEAASRRVTLDWNNKLSQSVPLPASSVRQILLNLLLNAVAASPENSAVDVGIDMSAGHLILSVGDAGPGLPDHAADLLLGRSSRLMDAANGSGLGLWMTRRLVLEIKGTIACGSSSAGGSLIRVSLPLAREAELQHVA